MVKKFLVIAIMISVATTANSQEFWLQPGKFSYSMGEEFKGDLLVGENFEGEPLDLKRHKIEKIELHQANNVTDLKPQFVNEKEKAKFKFSTEGTYLMSVESTKTYKEWSAANFEAYLRDEGFEDLLPNKEKRNTESKEIKEANLKYAKTLLQVGKSKNETFKKIVGTIIEIVPQQNPFNLKPGEYLQCLILFNGKPLPHQAVKIWSKIGNSSILQNAYTEDNGIVKFPISSRGPWMVYVKKMISKKGEVDWQSLHGSLTFRIE